MLFPSQSSESLVWSTGRSFGVTPASRKLRLVRAIADFVAVTWNPDRLPRLHSRITPELFVKRVNPKLMAFEVKLSDWRGALMQANRYRFFAHVPVVVLPESKRDAALRHLETFRIVRVGLWSFDPKTNRITKHFTPRSAPPLDRRRQLRVLHLVARVSRALPIS